MTDGLRGSHAAGGNSRIGTLYFRPDADDRVGGLTDRSSMSVWPIPLVFAALLGVCEQPPMRTNGSTRPPSCGK